MKSIPFNKAVCLENSIECLENAVKDNKLSGNGKYTKMCTEWMEERFGAKKVLMTTSCTAALEMSAILLGIKEGDEVIINAFIHICYNGKCICQTGSQNCICRYKTAYNEYRPGLH